MRIIACLLLGLTLSFSSLKGEYEGTYTFHTFGKVEYSWMAQFLPYNPIIVEAGAYSGNEVIYAAKVWPKSKLVAAFEPNPRAFNQMELKVELSNSDNIEIYNTALNTYKGTAAFYLSHGPGGNDITFEHESSLLPPTRELEFRFRGPSITVPCVVLDEWCKERGVDHIDILRLELEGAELQVLQSSPDILKTVKILIVPSFFYPYRTGMPDYFVLKDFLTQAHFVPLAHWYEPGQRGLAAYISQELFDAYFVKCLGLGLGGLAYP